MSNDNNNFMSLATTVLGSYGEGIVVDRLKQKGYKIAKFDEEDGSHPIDILTWHRDTGYKIVEVKTKPRMTKYACTGIDVADWYNYQLQQLNLNMPIIIVWVDYLTKTIYGNEIALLKPSHKLPASEGRVEIQLFELSSMIHIGNLTDDEVIKLRQLDSSTYER